MKSLAIITARGGSKRIPRKNIKEFCGKPIIAYSIEAALKSGCFDEVMVSTDDKEIMDIALRSGASVPFMRSEATSNDHAGTDEVLAEVLSRYSENNITFDRFCCIYPTAPFITPDRLKEAMELLNDHESVCPVCAFSYPPQRGFIIKDGLLKRAYPEHALTRSQDLDKMYHDAGQFYACRTDAFLRDKTTDVEDMIPLILSDEEVQDIDTFEDWKIAERKFLALKNKKSFCSELKIGSHIIGPGHPAYIVAEMSANHLQDYNRAVEIIHAAKEAGADAVKLQTYTADTITINSDKPYFQITGGTIWDGTTLYKLYEEAYTPWEWQPKLYEEAKKLGLDCFSSPFDPTAVEFMEEMDMPAYKIASYEITDIPLIRLCASKHKPMILATGVARSEDIKLALDACLAENNTDVILLKCVSAYPTPYEDINLRMLPGLGKTHGCLTGLSDHSMGSTVPVGAVALGACMIEKHLTLSRADGGPDGVFSMEPDEFAEMVKNVRIMEKALGNSEYALTPVQETEREGARSLFIVSDIKKGEVLTPDNIRSIRPGNGLPPIETGKVMGKHALRDLERGEPLKYGDFE